MPSGCRTQENIGAVCLQVASRIGQEHLARHHTPRGAALPEESNLGLIFIYRKYRGWRNKVDDTTKKQEDKPRMWDILQDKWFLLYECPLSWLPCEQLGSIHWGASKELEEKASGLFHFKPKAEVFFQDRKRFPQGSPTVGGFARGISFPHFQIGPGGPSGLPQLKRKPRGRKIEGDHKGIFEMRWGQGVQSYLPSCRQSVGRVTMGICEHLGRFSHGLKSKFLLSSAASEYWVPPADAPAFPRARISLCKL